MNTNPMDKNKTWREDFEKEVTAWEMYDIIGENITQQVFDFIQSKIHEAEERGYQRGRQDEAYLNSWADQ